MPIAATSPPDHQSAEQPSVGLAFERGVTAWKLACTARPAPRPWARRGPADDRAAVRAEMARAQQRMGVPAVGRVVSGYEALQVADRFPVARNVSEALKTLLHSRQWPKPRTGLPLSRCRRPACPRR